MRQLHLQATSSKKRTSDEVPEQLKKRVTLSNTVWLHSMLMSVSFQLKSMERSLGKLSEAQMRTEKYQREQADSLKQLVALQKLRKSYVRSLTSLLHIVLTDFGLTRRPILRRTCKPRANRPLRRPLLHHRRNPSKKKVTTSRQRPTRP